MDIVTELEAMRKRVVQMINAEFDLLIERVASEGDTPTLTTSEVPYESRYPLTAGAKIFKGTKPTNVILENNKQIHVSTWKQVVSEVMQHCISDQHYKDALIALSDNISGRKRMLLAKTDENMRSPLKLCDNLYMETHYDTETLLNVLTIRILGAIQYDYSAIQVTIRNR